uniref:Uncharacterized protein n=1 Tax=Romanomermis culicivorax TaxID=13658 RepID=A0A915KIG1_ROMCU
MLWELISPRQFLLLRKLSLVNGLSIVNIYFKSQMHQRHSSMTIQPPLSAMLFKSCFENFYTYNDETLKHDELYKHYTEEYGYLK